MKSLVMVDVFYREQPRGPLERVVAAFGPLSRAEMWTLVVELEVLVRRYHLEGRDAANPSQEDEDRHPATPEA
jgi:hypothetical protein